MLKRTLARRVSVACCVQKYTQHCDMCYLVGSTHQPKDTCCYYMHCTGGRGPRSQNQSGKEICTLLKDSLICEQIRGVLGCPGAYVFPSSSGAGHGGNIASLALFSDLYFAKILELHCRYPHYLPFLPAPFSPHPIPLFGRLARHPI